MDNIPNTVLLVDPEHRSLIVQFIRGCSLHKQCVILSKFYMSWCLGNSARLFGFLTVAIRPRAGASKPGMTPNRAVNLGVWRVKGGLSPQVLLGQCCGFFIPQELLWQLEGLSVSIFYAPNSIVLCTRWSDPGLAISLQNQGQSEFNGDGYCFLKD